MLCMPQWWLTSDECQKLLLHHINVGVLSAVTSNQRGRQQQVEWYRVFSDIARSAAASVQAAGQRSCHVQQLPMHVGWISCYIPQCNYLFTTTTSIPFYDVLTSYLWCSSGPTSVIDFGCNTHTQSFYCSSGICLGPPGWAGTRKAKTSKVKPIWIYRSKR